MLFFCRNWLIFGQFLLQSDHFEQMVLEMALNWDKFDVKMYIWYGLDKIGQYLRKNGSGREQWGNVNCAGRGEKVVGK